MAMQYGLTEKIAVERALIAPGTGVFSDSRALETSSHFEGSMPPVLSLDELLARHHVDAIDFLKVDVEGSEFALFETASSWLYRVRQLAMEVHPRFGVAAKLQQVLESNGLIVQVRDETLKITSHVPAGGGYMHARR